MLRVALKVSSRNADVPYMHAWRPLPMNSAIFSRRPRSRRARPWACAARSLGAACLAHVMLTRGRIDEGARFLEGLQDTWTGLNSFMSTHLWWHLALFYLSQGRHGRVLEIYDRYCWAIAKDYSQDQIGAVSLLARMEIAGIDVGGRWQDLGDHLAGRAHDTVQPFLTLQYLYGLARAGRIEAEELLRSVRVAAGKSPSSVREVWRDVALPAGEGLYAYAQGDFDAAWRHLSVAMPRMMEAGGSHAQRDLFEQILLDAAIKSGRNTLAQQLLELRRLADPDGVPVNAALSDVYVKLGLPDLAEQARVRATLTRSRHPG